MRQRGKENLKKKDRQMESLRGIVKQRETVIEEQNREVSDLIKLTNALYVSFQFIFRQNYFSAHFTRLKHMIFEAVSVQTSFDLLIDPVHWWRLILLTSFSMV